MLRHDLFVVLISQSVMRPGAVDDDAVGGGEVPLLDDGVEQGARGEDAVGAATQRAISGSRSRPCAVYALPEKPEPISLASAAFAMAFAEVRVATSVAVMPARARPHPRDPVAGVRDDPGGEFGGHVSTLRRADDSRGATCGHCLQLTSVGDVVWTGCRPRWQVCLLR